MKKVIMFLSIGLLFITGCSKNSLKLKNPNVITYKNIEIIKDDYNNILKEINKVNFDTDNAIDFLNGNYVNLIIEDTSDTYYFVFVNDKLCYQLQGEEESGSYKCGDVSNTLEPKLDSLYNDYTREDYYDINYVPNNNDLKGGVIEFDKTKNALIININETSKFNVDKVIFDDENTLSKQNIYTNDAALGKYIINVNLKETPTISIKLQRVDSVYKILMPILDKDGNMTYYGLEN